MKQLLISIAMVLTLSMNAEAAAQKHRHSPRTEQVDSSKSKVPYTDKKDNFSERNKQKELMGG